MNIQQMKFYRQQMGYSYAALSKLSGVPLGTIQKIFNGETKSPRYETMKALERVLKPQENADSIQEPGAAYKIFTTGYTLSDYYALPDEKRVELIDGVFYDQAAPSLSHQSVLMDLSALTWNFIREKDGKCRTFTAPVDVQLDCDEKTMVQPDMVIVCDESKLSGQCIKGAPDFIMEILSPSTRQKDMFLKLAKYRNAGVREYWMADIEKQRIVTYFFEEDDIPVIYGFAEKVPVKIFEGELEIDFSQVRYF